MPQLNRHQIVECFECKFILNDHNTKSLHVVRAAWLTAREAEIEKRKWEEQSFHHQMIRTNVVKNETRKISRTDDEKLKTYHRKMYYLRKPPHDNFETEFERKLSKIEQCQQKPAKKNTSTAKNTTSVKPKSESNAKTKKTKKT